jgi:hypothetical protein
MNKQNPEDKRNQLERFKEASRELGCDDSEGRFREVMRRVAKAKPKPKDDKAKPSRMGKSE